MGERFPKTMRRVETKLDKICSLLLLYLIANLLDPHVCLISPSLSSVYGLMGFEITEETHDIVNNCRQLTIEGF
jgi:hypothetical protein